MKRISVILVLAFSTAALSTGQVNPRAQTNASSAPSQIDGIDYTTEQNFSGADIIEEHTRLPTERDLQTPCQVRRQAISSSLAEFESSLKSLQGEDNQAAWTKIARLHHSAGQVHLYTGDIKRAISEFEASYRVAADHQDASLELRQMVLDNLKALGVAHLRRGEVENCTLNHNAERCILPLSIAAQHQQPSGSENAIQYFEKYLAQSPNNLEMRWLLNIAYMTLGKYPDKVRREYLIPLPTVESKEKLKRFPDVASAVGLGAMGNAGGMIVDDFDNDGFLDVVISNVDPCSHQQFYHNNGDGTFSDWSEKSRLSEQPGSINLVQTDFNNDRFLDIFVMRGGWEFPMRNSLLKNNGDGTFTDVTVQSGLGNTLARTASAAWADYDNDGWLDLYVGHENSTSQLFRNRGNGTFEDVSSKAHVDFFALTKGVTWGDYDNDGYPDLYASNYGDLNFLFHNNRDGTFDEVAADLRVDKPKWSFPTWFWDYDNDGWLDIFVASYSYSIRDLVRTFLGQPVQGETMKLYHNTGKGSFEDVTKTVGLDRVVPAMGANFGDLDGDGYLDFYLGTGTPSFSALVPNFMFRNRGGNAFINETAATGTGHLQKGHGVSFSDINNDGAQDVAANIGGAVPGDTYNKSLFLNPGHGNNWISIKLVGVKTNRAAIGARIKLTLRENNQGNSFRYRDVTSGGSFGDSSLTQNIGLGKVPTIASLEVWWPTSKTRQTFPDVVVNQFIEITEFAKTYTKRPLRSINMDGKSPPMPHMRH